jgi:hypothetical protein
MYGNFINDQRSDCLVIAVAVDRSFQQMQPLCSVGPKLCSRGRVGRPRWPTKNCGWMGVGCERHMAYRWPTVRLDDHAI